MAAPLSCAESSNDCALAVCAAIAWERVVPLQEREEDTGARPHSAAPGSTAAGSSALGAASASAAAGGAITSAFAGSGEDGRTAGAPVGSVGSGARAVLGDVRLGRRPPCDSGGAAHALERSCEKALGGSKGIHDAVKEACEALLAP